MVNFDKVYGAYDLKNRWNLLDYGDVIVHVLHKEERETYAIERFWNHAFCVDEEEWKQKSEEFSIYKNTIAFNKFLYR